MNVFEMDGSWLWSLPVCHGMAWLADLAQEIGLWSSPRPGAGPAAVVAVVATVSVVIVVVAAAMVAPIMVVAVMVVSFVVVAVGAESSGGVPRPGVSVERAQRPSIDSSRGRLFRSLPPIDEPSIARVGRQSTSSQAGWCSAV